MINYLLVRSLAFSRTLKQKERNKLLFSAHYKNYIMGTNLLEISLFSGFMGLFSFSVIREEP